jgi:hypothetical protein
MAAPVCLCIVRCSARCRACTCDACADPPGRSETRAVGWGSHVRNFGPPPPSSRAGHPRRFSVPERDGGAVLRSEGATRRAARPPWEKGSHTWTTARARQVSGLPATPARPTGPTGRLLTAPNRESATPVRLRCRPSPHPARLAAMRAPSRTPRPRVRVSDDAVAAVEAASRASRARSRPRAAPVSNRPTVSRASHPVSSGPAKGRGVVVAEVGADAGSHPSSRPR